MDAHVQPTEFMLKCCYDVANELGVGFWGNVYKNALVVALTERPLKGETEKVFEILSRKKRAELYIADNSFLTHPAAASAILPARGPRFGAGRSLFI